MILTVAVLALWSGLFEKGRDVRAERYQAAPGWTLNVRHDGFSGTTSCLIKGRKMTYRHGVLTFHFSPRTDTANALYRVDQGPAQSVGLVAPEAAGLGAEFKSKNTKNPSDGKVHIPTSHLEAAQTVAVRPNKQRRATSFSLSGFEQAITVARQLNCDVP